MSNDVFICMSSRRIAHLISQSRHRVVLTVPSVIRPVAEVLREYAAQHRGAVFSILIDCDDHACRLDYGNQDAISILVDNYTPVRQ